MSFKLRSGFKTVAGRIFQPGLTEAVVSKRISERFQGLEIGDKFRIQTTDYTVVGLFDSAGKAFESEIWVDINSLSSTTKRNDYSSALLRVKDQNAMLQLVGLCPIWFRASYKLRLISSLICLRRRFFLSAAEP